MRRTARRLADGREIIYFDHDADADSRDAVDERDLDPTTTQSEVRYDPRLDEWVIIAAHRQSRTYLPPADQCPLCPTRPGGHASEIPAADYEVVVFENRFPSFTTEVDPALAAGADEPLSPRRPGVGRCEVVCFTSDHESTFAKLSHDRVRLVIDTWVDRTVELSALPHVEQVFCFENRGEQIGVTLNHPHGQIYAYPFVPPTTRRMLDSARRYRERTWRNLFADLLAAERADGSRVVVSSDYWTAFVPAAARWPLEVHLYPNRQVPDLAGLESAERDDLATIYRDVLRRLDSLYGAPLPYIAAWHQAPVRIDRELAYLHLELFSIQRDRGKLKYLAGSESAMGAFINDVRPESVAQRLREVADGVDR